MISEVQIVDFGLGNLFSVQKALERAGLQSNITNDPADLKKAEAVILPGVGAFPKAMWNLKDRRLDFALKDFVETGNSLIGICLGQHLMMESSCEFEVCDGLGFFKGSVKKLPSPQVKKIPAIGWSELNPASQNWDQGLLKNVVSQADMYFVHSYYVEPHNEKDILAKTSYADIEFASAIAYENITGFQFHPEKSGKAGQKIYDNLAQQLKRK